MALIKSVVNIMRENSLSELYGMAWGKGLKNQEWILEVLKFITLFKENKF